jgi:hypothetical protein
VKDPRLPCVTVRMIFPAGILGTRYLFPQWVRRNRVLFQHKSRKSIRKTLEAVSKMTAIPHPNPLPQGERERQRALRQFFGDLFVEDVFHGQGTNHYTTE